MLRCAGGRPGRDRRAAPPVRRAARRRRHRRRRRPVLPGDLAVGGRPATVLRTPEEIRAVYENIVHARRLARHPPPDDQHRHRDRGRGRRRHRHQHLHRAPERGRRADRDRGGRAATRTATTAVPTAGTSPTACSTSTCRATPRATSRAPAPDAGAQPIAGGSPGRRPVRIASSTKAHRPGDRVHGILRREPPVDDQPLVRDDAPEHVEHRRRGLPLGPATSRRSTARHRGEQGVALAPVGRRDRWVARRCAASIGNEDTNVRSCSVEWA